MSQTEIPGRVCRSVFQKGAPSPDPKTYTRLWIALVNQMERGRHILSDTR